MIARVREYRSHREALAEWKRFNIAPPVDDEADYALPVWAGVVPLQLQALSPIDDPKLSGGIDVPGYISSYMSTEREPNS